MELYGAYPIICFCKLIECPCKLEDEIVANYSKELDKQLDKYYKMPGSDFVINNNGKLTCILMPLDEKLLEAVKELIKDRLVKE